MLGMYVSYYVDAPPGATIVLILAGVFAIVYAGTAIVGRQRLRSLGDIDAHTDVAGPMVDAH